MNKKFLSVVVFGALLASSAGTFTSCKDYDDDIDAVNGRIDELAKSLSDLQAKVGSFVKSVTYDPATGKLTVVDGENNSVSYTIGQNLPTYSISVDKEGKISLLKDGEVVSSGTITFPDAPTTPTIPDAFDPSKLTVDPTTGKVMYDGKETGVTIPGDGVLSIEDKKNAEGVVIGYTIKYKDQAVTFALNDVLTLKGLVFKSDLFVDGIEAIEYPYLDYTYKAGSTAATTQWEDEQAEKVLCKVITDSKEWNYTGGTGAQYNPIEYINYHLNPSSAKVSKEDLSFVSRDVEVISSRASVALPEVADMKPADEGILPVGLRAIGKDIKQGGEGSILALQAIVKAKSDAQADTTVTSDYALLYASKVTPQAIAFNDATLAAEDCRESANPDELFKTVEGAITHAPTLTVAYNSFIDLKNLLTIHYNREGQPEATKNDGTHKVWAYGDEAKYGLKYDFAFIQYTSGQNVTSDSKYADANTIKEGVLTPRIVNSAGETLNEQGVSSVGKRPVVRVRVTDADGRVVLAGFIKIEIAKQVDDIVTSVFDKGTHNFGCDEADAILTWSEISYQLLEKAAVQSKDEFDALYEFDVDDSGVAKQFAKSADGKSFVPAAIAQVIGTVKEKVDETGTTNTVLHWTLTTAEQSGIYEMAGHTATIYVRYVSKLNTTSHAPIYMPLQIAVAKPQGTVVTKLTNYWYSDGDVAKDGQNTRLNVPYPQDNGNTLNYVVDLNQVWEKGMPTFTPPANFASYTDVIFANQNGAAGGYKYYFDADQNVLTVDGTKYTLSVDNTTAACITGGSYKATAQNMIDHALKVDAGVFTNTKLYANGTVIATIDQNTGKITYENNDTSKKLLNAYSHSAAKHFAKIGICAYSPCNIAMSLTNNTYNAYFLRPIDAVGTDGGEFVDAHANGSTLDIAKLFNFQDWRNVKFVDGTDYSNSWLYAFYGLNKVEVKIADATTTLSGGKLGETLLSSKTEKIVLTQTDKDGNKVTSATLNLSSYNTEASGTQATYDAIVAAMGKIKYVNNGNNVQTFELRIPVEFTYTWGTVKTTVDCTVKSTMGN